MYKRLKEFFSPSKQLDEGTTASTGQFTPITIKQEQMSDSTSSSNADLVTAVNTILSHESSEKEFKKLPDLSSYSI